MTQDGELVWNGPTVNASNFRLVTFENKPTLTYWSGVATTGTNIGHGYGNVTFLDTAYNKIVTVCPDLGIVNPDGFPIPCQADPHESFVTDRNTLLVSAYNATPTDLTSINGTKDGWVFDCLFFEIEPRSGKILFRWSALEHVPVSKTFAVLGTAGTKEAPFDYFHINSIINIGDTWIVNGRHTWSTYKLNSHGKIEWTLEGETGGDFGPLPTKGKFRWQHFVRHVATYGNKLILSIFNNNSNNRDTAGPTSGLTLELTVPPNKRTPPVVLQDLVDPKDLIDSGSQGSNELLSNGNRFMGYGEFPVLKEFGPRGQDGNVRWSANFGPPTEQLVQSYRAYKFEWEGCPTTKPTVVLKESAKGCPTAYISWNGATNVDSYVIYGGASVNKLHEVAVVKHAGFETQTSVYDECIRVVPVIGFRVQAQSSSKVVCVGK